MAKPAAIDAYIAIDPSVVAANSEADTSGTTRLQQKSVEAVGSAKSIAHSSIATPIPTSPPT